MKTKAAAGTRAAKTNRASGRSGSVKSASKATAPQESTTCLLDIPRDKFRELEATATKQGFASLPEMILHCVTAYAWPSDRITVMGNWTDFKGWNEAARSRSETIDEWIIRSLNEAADSIENNIRREGGEG